MQRRCCLGWEVYEPGPGFVDFGAFQRSLLICTDGVIGLDVTNDGKWIVATTQRYLLVVTTEIPDDAKGRTGFDVSMGKNKVCSAKRHVLFCVAPTFGSFMLQPIPIKLTLDPMDLVKYNIQDVSFTPARFNIGSNIEEAWISSSTGPFLITWNFRKVKERRPFPYKVWWQPDVCASSLAIVTERQLGRAVLQIKPLAEDVVADQFRFDRADQLVVSLPNDVFLQRRYGFGSGLFSSRADVHCLFRDHFTLDRRNEPVPPKMALLLLHELFKRKVTIENTRPALIAKLFTFTGNAPICTKVVLDVLLRL